MRKVKINFTESDVNQMFAMVDGLCENQQVGVFTWTPLDDKGQPITVEITVGDDIEEEDTDYIDEILDECPSCKGDGYVTIDVEDSKGRDREKDVTCRDDWHGDVNEH